MKARAPPLLVWSTNDLVSFPFASQGFLKSPCPYSIDLVEALECSSENPNRDAASQYHACSRALLGLLAQDIGVTSVEDGHGGAAEELTAGGTKLNLL